MSQSTQHKIDNVRKPRVHITYDVETNGAVVKKELPFVMGVMGDFSGNPNRPLPSLSNRKFVSIDRDNFNRVMTSIAPELNLKVKNTLAGDGSETSVNLQFRSMDDFNPAAVAGQVPMLKRLLESRDKLRDLLSTADLSENLEKVLEGILGDADAVRRLAAELGQGGSSASNEE